MINKDTPEEKNDFKDLNIAGHFSYTAIKYGPSKFLITRLTNYSLALQVVDTPKTGIFYYILN